MTALCALLSVSKGPVLSGADKPGVCIILLKGTAAKTSKEKYTAPAPGLRGSYYQPSAEAPSSFPQPHHQPFLLTEEEKPAVHLGQGRCRRRRWILGVGPSPCLWPCSLTIVLRRGPLGTGGRPKPPSAPGLTSAVLSVTGNTISDGSFLK